MRLPGAGTDTSLPRWKGRPRGRKRTHQPSLGERRAHGGKRGTDPRNERGQADAGPERSRGGTGRREGSGARRTMTTNGQSRASQGESGSAREGQIEGRERNPQQPGVRAERVRSTIRSATTHVRSSIRAQQQHVRQEIRSFTQHVRDHCPLSAQQKPTDEPPTPEHVPNKLRSSPRANKIGTSAIKFTEHDQRSIPQEPTPIDHNTRAQQQPTEGGSEQPAKSNDSTPN